MPDSSPDRSPATEWEAVAADLDWQRPWRELFREEPPYHRWFVDGSFNLAANCTDRHLPARATQVAFHWEGEPGDRRSLTFEQLHGEVVRLARGLRDLGVGVGDRIALHQGWLPETVVSMLAAWRIGAEITVIPVVLPVEALASRLGDYRPKVLITQDGGWRRGTILPLKARADEALESSSGVEHTIVVRRTGVQVNWFEGDIWYDDLLDAAGEESSPTELPAEHPAVAVYLANHRGSPVAIHMGGANLAATALANHRHALSRGEVFWGAADVSWLGAQSHGVLGPLLAGTTSVMYEGTLDHPDPTRAWQIIERYGVTALLTSPSVVRALRTWSLEPSHATGSLQRIVCIGERLDPELRAWLGRVIGTDVDVLDAWGQLELGGIVAYEPGMAHQEMPVPGFEILDPQGRPVPDGEVGEWVMVGPWAGVLRAVDAEADPTAYHWERHPGHYSSGDLARRGAGGRVEFLGRLDEVISVSGQLVSLTDVRNVLLDQPFVARAEVFERNDTHVGRTVGAAIVLEPGAPDDEPTLRALQDSVRELLGGLSRPRVLLVLDRMGEELEPAAVRRALALVSGAAGVEPMRVSWEQVVAAAR